jgi:signal transduction histidine kinase
MNALLRRFDAVIDAFVPPAVRAGPAEDSRRGRLAVALALALVFFFSFTAAAQWATGNARGTLLSVFFIGLNLLATLVYRLTGRLTPTAHGVLGASLLAVLALAAFVRGAGLTGATVALLQIPLFATLLLGVRAAAVWTVASVAAGAAIGIMGRAGVIVDQLPARSRLLSDHIVIAVSTMILFAVAALYEHRREAALRQVATLAEEKRTSELARLRALGDAQLAQAAGVAALARIAASAAHEINNPLSAVAHNLQFVAESLPPSTAVELRDSLKDGAEGVERIRKIVAAMRLPDKKSTAISIHDAVTSALKLAESYTPGVARVRVTIEAVPLVVADETRLIQVLVRLLVSAAQGSGKHAGDGPEISVVVRNAGDSVVVEVRDDALRAGASSPPSSGAQVAGMELGLTMCASIVQSFGGTLTSESAAFGNVVRLTLMA